MQCAAQTGKGSWLRPGLRDRYHQYVVGFKAAQCEGRVADANSDGLATWKSGRDDAQGFAFDESEFEQAQADVSILDLGHSSAHLAHGDRLADANAA